jgi:hypothetical protein
MTHVAQLCQTSMSLLPRTVPTPKMKNGDFSEDPNANLYGIWDPFSTVGPNAQL